MPQAKTCAIALGSNLGDRQKNLEIALEMLRETPGIHLVKQSLFYETEPEGYVDQPCFLNSAVLINTGIDPLSLLDALLAIEKRLGRIRMFRWGPRTIDLDLIFIEQEIIETDDLVVPHPRMHERLFVLRPLLDIAPEWVHPIKHLTIKEMIISLCDLKRIIGKNDW